MVLVLFTANGVFVPLEVGFNRARRVAPNRSYLRNQAVALGMIFLCGGLALLSLMLAARNEAWLSQSSVARGAERSFLSLLLRWRRFRFPFWRYSSYIGCCPIVRWIPSAWRQWRSGWPTLEAMKYVNLLRFPLFREKLQREYGVFPHSALMLLWSSPAALVALAGAHGSAHAETHPIL